MQTAPDPQPAEDLGPAGFFDAVSEEYRPLPAAPALILYLAVPILAVPALVLAAAVLPVVLAVRLARGERVRGAAGALLRASARLLAAPGDQRAAAAEAPKERRMTPYSLSVARSLSAVRAGLRPR